MASRGLPSEQLTPTEAGDLRAALDDEYKAHATYTQVLADFGEVLPFANIVEAEQRHIDALLRLFHRHGLDVPADSWPGRVTRYASTSEACQAGVEAEIENAALYDRLLAGTTRPDLLETYRNLQQASQQHHLPAFRRGTGRHSSGAGRRRGDGGSTRDRDVRS